MLGLSGEETYLCYKKVWWWLSFYSLLFMTHGPGKVTLLVAIMLN